ncbi:fatty-acyl-CoA synthase [Bradyrhizobium elkanii]|uniref:acyl-CoA synthetase n=1 Tax=Bradyrhizobium elkanii TaxID=29448 RepID=UPI00351411FC
MGVVVSSIKSLADVVEIERTPIEERLGASNVHDLFGNNAARFGDAPALIYLPNGRAGDAPVIVSHREHFAHINRTANLLSDLGVGRSDVVSYLLPNILENSYVLWGAEAVGVANPINFMLRPFEIAQILVAADTRVLVAWGGGDGGIYRRAMEARAQAPCVEHVIVVGRTGDGQQGVLSYEELAPRYPGDRLVSSNRAAPDDVAAYFHTGGTTGAPKLASQSHRAQLIQAYVAGEPFGFGPGEMRLNGLPLFHVAAVMCGVLGPLTSGAATLFNGPFGYRNRDALADTWRLIETHRVTSMNSVPTVLAALLDQPVAGADLSSLRYVGGGAAPSSPVQTKAFERHVGTPVIEGYGMTEAGALITCNPIKGEIRHGTVGLRMPYVEVMTAQLVDRGDLRACATGEIGDVFIRGPSVTAGYKRAEDNESAFVAGWFQTGDCGWFDADGYLTLTGRSKDLIIRGGHNIDPSVVEEALRRHHAVELCSAVGYPDRYAGELPAAYVRLRAGASVSAEDLKAFAHENVGERPAAPAEVFVVEEIPVTAVGKLFKPPLRRDAIGRAFRKALTGVCEGRCAMSIEVVDDARRGMTALVTLSGATGAILAEVARKAAERLGQFNTPSEVRLLDVGTVQIFAGAD